VGVGVDVGVGTVAGIGAGMVVGGVGGGDVFINPGIGAVIPMFGTHNFGTLILVTSLATFE
jgi:hypothetical protein